MARPTDWLDKELANPQQGRRARARMTRDQVIRAAGGRTALARRMAGIGPGKLPPKGSTARKSYDSAMRSIQRAEKAPGQINPKTGRPYETRPGTKKIEAIGKALRREKQLLRRREITLTNVSATTMINNNPDYSKERSFQDVTLTRAEFREILRARNAGRTDEADALIGAKLAESRRLVGAKGITSVEISDITSGEIT
jgi:hypothetical protein